MASFVRSPFIVSESLTGGSAAVRASIIIQEALTGGNGAIRLSLVGLEAITGGNAIIRTSLLASEALTGGNPYIDCSLLILEVLTLTQPQEDILITALFPTLLGLQWPVGKTPEFSTKISEHVSGREVRTAFWQYPRYLIDLSFEWLSQKNGKTDCDTLMGFFLQRQGSFDAFLFHDKTDYKRIDEPMLETPDGVDFRQFTFVRALGGFTEPVGQVDEGRTVSVYVKGTKDFIVPSSGPYTIAVPSGVAYLADFGVMFGATAMTKVVGAPTSLQYNQAGNVYTFNNARAGQTVSITWKYKADPAHYSITDRNQLLFDALPPPGPVTADFEYHFVCRFVDDQAAFSEFMENLWELQACQLRSLIL